MRATKFCCTNHTKVSNKHRRIITSHTKRNDHPAAYYQCSIRRRVHDARAVSARAHCTGIGADVLQSGTVLSPFSPRSTDHRWAFSKFAGLHVYTILKRFCVSIYTGTVKDAMIYSVSGCTVWHYGIRRNYPATLEENMPEKRALDRSRRGIWRATRNYAQSPVGFGDWLEISRFQRFFRSKSPGPEGGKGAEIPACSPLHPRPSAGQPLLYAISEVRFVKLWVDKFIPTFQMWG